MCRARGLPLTAPLSAPLPSASVHLTQALGYIVNTDDVLQEFNLKVEDKAASAVDLIMRVTTTYHTHLSSTADDGRSRLLAAYAKAASREEALMLAQNLHSTNYRTKTVGRGRNTFLSWLMSTQHPCMAHYTPDEIERLYQKKDQNVRLSPAPCMLTDKLDSSTLCTCY